MSLAKPKERELVQALLSACPHLQKTAIWPRIACRVVGRIGHVFRGIGFDGMGGKNLFRVIQWVKPLYLPADVWHLSWSPHVNHPKTGFWNSEDPETKDVLVSLVNESIIPKIAKLGQLVALEQYMHEVAEWETGFPGADIALTQFAMGQFIEGMRTRHVMLSRFAQINLDLKHFDSPNLPLLERCATMIDGGNEAEVAAVLRDMEHRTVSKLGLEADWTWKPFSDDAP
jgi:hypothetical protein